MKVLVALVLLVASANASSFPKDVAKKLIPSFATTHIIKGVDAKPHAAPYIVSLSSNYTKRHSHICGGTLIDKSWIVTAAHCIRKPVGMGVVAGLHERLDVDNENTQAREVDFGSVHESYGGDVGPYDIAILHVSEAFVISESVQPVILPYLNEIYSGKVQLYGWGQPKSYILTGSKTLQTVSTEIVEWMDCKNALPEGAPLHETNVCSDSMQQGISACNGDSGGPLVKENKNAPSELVGIVSWGYIPCGMANRPSIFTRVSSYIGWLDQMKADFYTLN